MTFNRFFGWLAAISFCAGVWFAPRPRPGQSNLDYILSDPPFWSLETLCAVVTSVAIVALIMGNLGNER